MKQQPFCELTQLAAAVPEGAKLVVPPDNCGAAMTASRELVSPAGVHRPGGPCGLLTGLAWFSFAKQKQRFRLDFRQRNVKHVNHEHAR